MASASIHVDVLIIGAGPAGSAAAVGLARAGFEVLMVDRSAFPREKVCGDALIPDALRALEHLAVKQAVLRRSRALDGVRVYAPDGHFVDISGDCACIPRNTFDEVLRGQAVNAGAQFISGYEVAHPLLDADTVVGAQFRNGRHGLRVNASVTLLATGAAAGPLERFGVCDRVTPSATAARVYVRTDEDFARPFRHLCISYDAAICPGYGWIFPVDSATFNVGVGYFYDCATAPPEKNIRRLFERFARTFPPAVDIMAHATSISELRGAPLRTALAGSALSRPGLLVVGEAAGLTYSFTGEGIGKALESGILASEVITGCEAHRDGRPRAIADAYATGIRETFGARFRAYQSAQDWLASPLLANLLAWRARKSPFMRRQLSGVFQETTNPRQLFSTAGILRSFFA